MHVKRQIQLALRHALAAYLPVATTHLDYIDQLPARRCPAVLVRENERGEAISSFSAEGLQRRDLLVDVALCVALGEGFGDAVDALGLQTEKLLAAREGARTPEVEVLYALCPLAIELRAARTFLSGEGEQAIAVLRHTWQFSYVVDSAFPDEAIT